ncbi:MAG: hypothetical protein QNJ51_25855 [Calothrix sp. MO_167.B12]|nr:hypothetical protein [Calothrix sp. MO_167.B12]
MANPELYFILANCQVNRFASVKSQKGTVRAVTYNKIGSVAWWGQSWMGAAKLIRPICTPDSVGLDKARKLWEWAVNDTAKAISAQQEAAKVFLVREIWRKYPVTSTEKDRNAWMGKKPSKAKRLEGEKKFVIRGTYCKLTKTLQ